VCLPGLKREYTTTFDGSFSLSYREKSEKSQLKSDDVIRKELW
jgi:hypothetical protein